MHAKPVVKRLTKEEAIAAKPLWSEIFYEDSERFTDYYFAEKMADNTGYGVECGGRLCAMLFLTPYTGCIAPESRAGGRSREIPLSYIVGVGTRREYRHRGYMDRLLRTALSDLHAAGEPFTFLMPADPAIYASYQFRYIYDRPDFTVCRREEIPASVMEAGEAAALADFAQRELEGRYQLFLRRDDAYYHRQQKESRAMNGDIYLWKEQGEIAGFYLYAKENGKEEIQEAVVRADFARRGTLKITGAHPVIMARITNIKSMLSLMRLRADAPTETITVRLRLQDALLAAHNGTFLWTVGKKESTIAMLEATEESEACAEVAGLTEFLFGRKDCRACFGGAADSGVYERLSQIVPYTRLFLNEIV